MASHSYCIRPYGIFTHPGTYAHTRSPQLLSNTSSPSRRSAAPAGHTATDSATAAAASEAAALRRSTGLAGR